MIGQSVNIFVCWVLEMFMSPAVSIHLIVLRRIFVIELMIQERKYGTH